ncbi:hypothetical protein ID852_12800 [Xenorhabdus sp. 42]|uniref:hypothetical protein n=1 Tax=Xenorhabdus szentirmaii TaxID=290112 RepID=UPI0019984E6E|nr:MULTISPECIES: hypothetical protein [unclassified Xenorhabdus]MBD2792448.1 hypothetical protein [Xenorhabdus sp. CUL]MBD2803285.1 hypothetical protein [Xenorhabdus sp. ZM]MBD2821557.1 hypothetical protein [Xenorhabdus sp. 42]MBD2824917.1 hypothetical protein [Xenorhabdus sp. 5]
MKLKFILTIIIAMAINNYAYSYAGNCDANLNKIGYVATVYMGADDLNDGGVTFNFVPDDTSKAVTISFYHKMSDIGTWKNPLSELPSKNVRALYAILLTAYVSGSKVKIQRCYSNGVVALGISNDPKVL